LRPTGSGCFFFLGDAAAVRRGVIQS